MNSSETNADESVSTAGLSGNDLSPPVARSVGAVLADRPLSWREVLDDSALVTAALVGTAAAVVAVRVLGRR
jgi:hypothetical protein